MPRVSSLLLLCAVLAACARGGDPAARPDPAAGPNPSAPGKSTYELDAPPVAEVGNLCLFRTRKEPVMSGFVDRTGAAWEGEVRVRDLPSLDPKWFSPSDSRMATVAARPRVERFRVRIDDNCYDAARKVYYSCSKVLEADLSKVRGFARALSIGRARSLAIQLCEKKVRELVETTLEIKQDNADLRCRIVEQAYCELPPAPPPPPAPAKKS